MQDEQVCSSAKIKKEKKIKEVELDNGF